MMARLVILAASMLVMTGTACQGGDKESPQVPTTTSNQIGLENALLTTEDLGEGWELVPQEEHTLVQGGELCGKTTPIYRDARAIFNSSREGTQIIHTIAVPAEGAAVAIARIRQDVNLCEDRYDVDALEFPSFGDESFAFTTLPTSNEGDTYHRVSVVFRRSKKLAIVSWTSYVQADPRRLAEIVEQASRKLD